MPIVAKDSNPVDLSIVIVSYNTQAILRQCLQSVRACHGDLHVQVFVVDNASIDGSPDMVEEEFPEVELIRNKINVGFAKANNQALRKVTGTHILLLNSDVVLGADTIAKTLKYMQSHPQVGVVTCKLILPDGRLDLACRRSFPTPFVALWRLVGLSRLFPRSKTFAQYNLTYLDEDTTYEVDAVVGAYMLMTREAFMEVGLLDESFFMYGEDLDWCYRFRQAGYGVVYYPEAVARHHKGASSLGRKPYRMVREFHRAMELFYRKYFAKKYFIALNWIVYAGIYGHFGFNFLQSKLYSLTARNKEVASRLTL
ncbi:MAG TPA: glycosyltransferase family 2 protein [bacterium]|nr:glycosyltransferase family 2 protein [bacterium]